MELLALFLFSFFFCIVDSEVNLFLKHLALSDDVTLEDLKSFGTGPE